MSQTSSRPSNSVWLRKWLRFEPHQVIGSAEDPYLRRWYIIPRNPLLNVYLHQFCRSDDDRALHDHPWWFVSLILRGGYDEVTELDRRKRRAGSIAYRPAEWRHRVALWPEMRRMQFSDGAWSKLKTQTGVLPCWTLIVTGRRSRVWGFWCPPRGRNPFSQHFVPWTEWDDNTGCGETA